MQIYLMNKKNKYDIIKKDSRGAKEMEQKNNKKDLKKLLKKIFLTGAVVCTVAISLVGCSYQNGYLDDYFPSYSNEEHVDFDDRNEYNDNYYGDNENKYPSNTEENYESTSYNSYLYSAGSLSSIVPMNNFGLTMSKYTDNADRRLQEGNYQGINIDLSKENYNKYLNWVNSKDVVYVYADLYDVDYALSEATKFTNQVSIQTHQHTDLITSIDKIPTGSQVYAQISRNTTNYLNTHKGYYALSDDYMQKVAKILVSMVEEYYDDWSKEDKQRIYCMLNDISLVGIDSSDFTVNELQQLYNARVTDDGVIMLDLEQMANLGDELTIDKTLAHEIAHLFQRMCPDHRIATYTQIGNSQYFDSLDTVGKANSIHFQWLYEAAAEQMSMKEYSSPVPLVYNNMVGYLHTLDLITLIRPNYEENSIAISQMSTNPNAIYEVFGAKTAEEKKEIAHMLYSICYIQTEREDFITVYEKNNGALEDKKIEVKKIMKESVIQTMTKYFYKNLAERVHNGDVTLQDAFYLINTFESAINLHIIYDDAERYEYNEDAIKLYVELQDEFFRMIAEDSNMTFEDIERMFNDYSLIIKTDKGYERNYSFNWLTASEKEYVGIVLTTNLEHLTTNIRNVDYIKQELQR